MISNRELHLQQSDPMQEEQYLQQFNPYKEMKLKLERPIVFIDLETTETDIAKAKIVEIAIIKLNPDMSREELIKRINPGVAISFDAYLVHGINNEMVKDEPKFRYVAHFIYDFIKGCDVGGYNSNRFDVPILFKEFEHSGIYWNHNEFDMIDVCNIFKIKESRDLTAAYKFYCGKTLEGAHNAKYDISATLDVFLSQMEMYEDLPGEVNKLSIMSNYNKAIVDLSGNFYMDDKGNIRFSKGKYRDNNASNHLDYLNWMLHKSDWPHDTRVVCARLLGEPEPKMLPHN